MRIIHVSYRLPIKIENQSGYFSIKKSSGGLVTALSTIAKDQNIESVWIGVADFSKAEWLQCKETIEFGLRIEPVFMDKKLNKNFYHGFSNSVLWPLFHYFPSFVEFREEYFSDYVRGNEIVAQNILSIYKSGDIVWIHDYHFLPLPGLIRKEIPEAKIGYFLHIPFPHYEVFRILPGNVKNYLISHILAADLIGFQTWDHAANFFSNVENILGLHHSQLQINFNNRNSRIGIFPISVDYDKFSAAFHNPDSIAEKEILQAMYQGQRILFSVDRLDYTKGVLYRLNAFELFIQKFPEWKGKVVFIIVVVPSRDEIHKYAERKQMIELSISRINGQHGSCHWTPIVYQYRSMEFDRLIGLYIAADIALISPIRDGMNLIAKEFVASRQDKQGVLMLSELAGAACELKEAVLFNPLDTQQMSDQIESSLRMTSEEQQRRMTTMQSYVKKRNVFNWAETFLQSLNESWDENRTISYFEYEHKLEMLYHFSNAEKRLILLDYDGTLINFFDTPQLAVPGAELVQLLRKISANLKNIVCIVSGRQRETLENWFGTLNIDLVAEHGASIKQGSWRERIEDVPAWKSPVTKIMNAFAEIYPESFVEQKKIGIAWHYRKLEDSKGVAASKELISQLKTFLEPGQGYILDGKKVVEVRSSLSDKGRVLNEIYRIPDFDFILAIGDDQTDEDMFSVLDTAKHYSIKVGLEPTNARFRLDTVQQVLSLLPQLQ